MGERIMGNEDEPENENPFADPNRLADKYPPEKVEDSPARKEVLRRQKLLYEGNIDDLKQEIVNIQLEINAMQEKNDEHNSYGWAIEPLRRDLQKFQKELNSRGSDK